MAYKSSDQIFKDTLLFETGLRFNLKTDDPVVNWRIDCHKSDQYIPYDKVMYEQEIFVWRKSGGKILSISWE